MHSDELTVLHTYDPKVVTPEFSIAIYNVACSTRNVIPDLLESASLYADLCVFQEDSQKPYHLRGDKILNSYSTSSIRARNVLLFTVLSFACV